jgi:hypothetical protein
MECRQGFVNIIKKTRENLDDILGIKLSVENGKSDHKKKSQPK